MFNPNRIPPEERQIYEDALSDAAILPNGECRPTAEAGQHLYAALINLASDYQWADELIETAACHSLGRRAKEWAKQQELIDTPFGQRTITRSARAAVKRRNESGARVDQMELWENFTDADLIAIINRNEKMVSGIEVETSTAILLLQLCREYAVHSVADALDAKGCTLQQFLDNAAEASA